MEGAQGVGYSVGGDVGHMEMGGTAVTATPHPTAWNCQLCPLHPKARSSHWGAAGGAGMGMGTSNVERQRVTGNGGKQNGSCGGMGGRRGCGGTGDPGKDDRGHIGEGGNQGKRGCGAVGTRRYGVVGMWGHGDMGMWGCGALQEAAVAAEGALRFPPSPSFGITARVIYRAGRGGSGPSIPAPLAAP